MHLHFEYKSDTRILILLGSLTKMLLLNIWVAVWSQQWQLIINHPEVLWQVSSDIFYSHLSWNTEMNLENWLLSHKSISYVIERLETILNIWTKSLKSLLSASALPYVVTLIRTTYFYCSLGSHQNVTFKVNEWIFQQDVCKVCGVLPLPL